MNFDLSTLSTEEKDYMLNQLLEKHNASSEETTGHSDEVQDTSMINDRLEPFINVIEILIDEFEKMEARYEKLESLVVDDLFGGIESMYKSNVRAKGVQEKKAKYGSMFDPMIPALKELAPDEDVYEKLYDLLDQMKSEAGDDFDEEGTVNGIASTLSEKFGKIKGVGSEGVKPVDGVGIEVKKVEAFPAGADSAFMDKVKEMRDKSKGIKQPF